MSSLQGLLLLLFLIALRSGLVGAFLKALGTESKLASYPPSQPLQQAEQVLSSGQIQPRLQWAKPSTSSPWGRKGSETPAYSSQPSKEAEALSSLRTPELALIPGASRFGFLATNRAG